MCLSVCVFVCMCVHLCICMSKCGYMLCGCLFVCNIKTSIIHTALCQLNYKSVQISEFFSDSWFIYIVPLNYSNRTCILWQNAPLHHHHHQLYFCKYSNRTVTAIVQCLIIEVWGSTLCCVCPVCVLLPHITSTMYTCLFYICHSAELEKTKAINLSVEKDHTLFAKMLHNAYCIDNHRECPNYVSCPIIVFMIPPSPWL